jgi:hypothetical protein
MEKINFILSVCCRIKNQKNRKTGKYIITHEILLNEFFRIESSTIASFLYRALCQSDYFWLNFQSLKYFAMWGFWTLNLYQAEKPVNERFVICIYLLSDFCLGVDKHGCGSRILEGLQDSRHTSRDLTHSI